MGSFGKWLTGFIILAIAALILELFTPWGAKANSAAMGNSVSTALNDGGFKNVTSAMAGNVAKLSGVVTSADARSNAITAAENAQCEKCTNRESGKRWHEVDGTDINVVKPVVTVSPYTLTGERTDDGGIVLNGYVHDDDAKAALLMAAEKAFPGKVTDNKVRIGHGAPTENWLAIATANMAGLSNLDTGRFTMKDMDWTLAGKASSVAIRSRVNSSVDSLGVSTNISVDNAVAENVGQIKDGNVCQQTFDRLKGGTKIQFASGSAEITDTESLKLLSDLAAAAQQCSSFNITIAGHTDSTGIAESNRVLSESRATAVADVLFTSGVVQTQLFTRGYGQDRPVATNGTREGRTQNRRIEFTITKSK
ncbi:MAG: hypothetical protein COA43_03170 [Robiginitomaculum sp.]|nr:MAG: hypothetical protein COA43_03170 [Robiginitomaculum sp.]